MPKAQEGVTSSRRSRDPNEFVMVPPRSGDGFKFGFKFRDGPRGIPVVTAFAVFEVKPQRGSPSRVKSRPQKGAYEWARKEAIRLLGTEGNWAADTAVDPLPNAELDKQLGKDRSERSTAGARPDNQPEVKDLTGRSIALMESQMPPGKDDLHYARFIIPFVRARLEGMKRTAAYRAVQKALTPSLSTIRADVKEAESRKLDVAARALLDDGLLLTSERVVARVRNNRLMPGGWEEPIDGGSPNVRARRERS